MISETVMTLARNPFHGFPAASSSNSSARSSNIPALGASFVPFVIVCDDEIGPVSLCRFHQNFGRQKQAIVFHHGIVGVNSPRGGNVGSVGLTGLMSSKPTISFAILIFKSSGLATKEINFLISALIRRGLLLRGSTGNSLIR